MKSIYFTGKINSPKEEYIGGDLYYSAFYSPFCTGRLFVRSEIISILTKAKRQEILILYRHKSGAPYPELLNNENKV